METEIELPKKIKRIEQIEYPYENKKVEQRSCGPKGCLWCESFLTLLCCPCLFITFIFGKTANLIKFITDTTRIKWEQLLTNYLEKQEETTKQADKTTINWLETSYHIVFELYKVVISSFLTIFTQQKCFASDGSITTCTMYDNLIPNTNLDMTGLVINSIMFFGFISQYVIEILREHYLIKYLEHNTEVPNNSSTIDMFKNNNNAYIFRKLNNYYYTYMRVSQIVLIMYLANIGVSAAVVYYNYLNKSSIIGFVTNALFVFIKIGSIIKITSEKDNIYYSAYRKQHIHYNIINKKTFEKYNYTIEQSDINPSYYYDENDIQIEIIDEYEPEMGIVETLSEY